MRRHADARATSCDGHPVIGERRGDRGGILRCPARARRYPRCASRGSGRARRSGRRGRTRRAHGSRTASAIAGMPASSNSCSAVADLEAASGSDGAIEYAAAPSRTPGTPSTVASPAIPETPESTGAMRNLASGEKRANPVPRPAPTPFPKLPTTTSAARQSTSTTPNACTASTIGSSAPPIASRIAARSARAPVRVDETQRHGGHVVGERVDHGIHRHDSAGRVDLADRQHAAGGSGAVRGNPHRRKVLRGNDDRSLEPEHRVREAVGR